MNRRVAITGIGTIVPGGVGRKSLWESVVCGVSAVSASPALEIDSLPVRIAACVDSFTPEEFLNRKWMNRTERCSQFALSAAMLAYEDAGLTLDAALSRRTGVFDGTSLGSINANLAQQRELNFDHTMRVSPSCLLKGMTGSSSGDIAMEFHLHGPAITFSMGSVSSSYAIGYAFRKIKFGELDAAFAGGSEAPISKEIVGLFSTSHLLSTENSAPATACKPFDLHRDGFVIGEGGAFLILEELDRAMNRGAHVYAEVAGFGESTDAYHPTTPDPEGRMIADAMTQALREAQLSPRDIQYINAHGTATQYNDVVETRAIREVFRDAVSQLAISSTKPVTGHLLGACGAVELAISVLALQSQWIPPTINLIDPDPACDLDYVPQRGRISPLDAAMSNNYSFGGRNASLVVKRFMN